MNTIRLKISEIYPLRSLYALPAVTFGATDKVQRYYRLITPLQVLGHGRSEGFRLFRRGSYPDLADRGLKCVLGSVELTGLGVARIELGQLHLLPQALHVPLQRRMSRGVAV